MQARSLIDYHTPIFSSNLNKRFAMRTIIFSLLLISYGFTFAQINISSEEKKLIEQHIAEFPVQTEFSIALVEGEEILY